MLRTFLAFAIAFIALLALEPAFAEPQRFPVVSMPREAFENAVWDYNRAKMGKESVVGTIQGLGGSADAVMTYDLKGKYEYFESKVGYIQGTPSGRSAFFEVWADGVLLYATEMISSGQEPDIIRIPVAKRQIMQLRIRPDRYEGTHGAAFGEPMLYNGVGPDFMNTLTINNNGKINKVTNGSKLRNVEVSVPLEPGEHEYTVRVKYDEKAGRVDIETVDAGGTPLETVPQVLPK